MFARHLTRFLVVAVLCSPVLAAGGRAESPEKLIDDFHLALIAVMKDSPTLSVRARYERLRPAIQGVFHVGYMAQIIAGRHWATASKEQRWELIQAFERMSVATLATLFNSYDGEKFELIRVVDGPQGTQLVETKFVGEDNQVVPFKYWGRTFREGWRAFDIIVDNNISELQRRTEEFHRILAEEGLPGLTRQLNAKAMELLADK